MLRHAKWSSDPYATQLEKRWRQTDRERARQTRKERERGRERVREAGEQRQRQSQSQRLPQLHLHFMASVFSDFVAVFARCLRRTSPTPSLSTPHPLSVSSPVSSRKLVWPSQHRTDDIASPKEVATFTILIRVVAVVVADLVDAFSQQEG